MSVSPAPSSRLVSVVLAALGVSVVLSWMELMFDWPSRLFSGEPSLGWFAAGAVVCAVLALSILKTKWAAVVALPAAGIFAAWCVAVFAVRMKSSDWFYPPPLFGYPGTAALAFCAVLPVALVIATTARRLGTSRRACGWLAGVLCLSPFVSFAAVNVIDFARFHLAWTRATRLSEQQLTALATRCATMHESHYYRDGDWPAEFAPLHPKSVIASSQVVYARLYSAANVDVELRVETDPKRRAIYCFTNSDGPQKTVLLWIPRPAGTSAVEPEQRIVTLSEYGMHSGPEWIVFRDRIRYVGPSEYPNRESDMIEIPLGTADREDIEHAAVQVKKRIGGRVFEAPVCDGLGLEIRWASDGSPSEEDTLLHNAWVEQAGPLIRTIARLSPANRPFRFEQRIKQMSAEFQAPPDFVRVRRMSEYRNERAPHPWWCVWRELLGEQVTGPHVIKYTQYIPDPLRYVYREP
jgi:hypothetical protein